MSKHFTARHRLFLTKDQSRVVRRGSAEAAYLFAAQGSEVSADDVKRFNLGPDLVVGAGVSAETAPVETDTEPTEQQPAEPAEDTPKPAPKAKPKAKR